VRGAFAIEWKVQAYLITLKLSIEKFKQTCGEPIPSQLKTLVIAPRKVYCYWSIEFCVLNSRILGSRI